MNPENVFNEMCLVMLIFILFYLLSEIFSLILVYVTRKKNENYGNYVVTFHKKQSKFIT